MQYGYKKLVVWQKSMDLVSSVYELLKSFPRDELYGLVSQMKRAAVSIPSNIAEGCKRRTTKEARQFYSIAYGSAGELETQLEIAMRLEFISEKVTEEARALLLEVQKMLHVMIYKDN